MDETANSRPLMMSTARFLDHVKEGYEAGIRYCFILGSGASVTSGIPMGRTLIEEWRGYLLKRGDSYIRECAADIGMDYASIASLFSPNYKTDSSDYFTFYDLRFAGKPVQAYWYLQRLMSAAEPSFGYYALAVLLEYTNNKLVITTNFDSLVEETLSLYHAGRPLVLGHESLATFMDSTENTGRSVIAKVHRDLLLHPKNSKEEMEKLAENWAEPLRNALSSYTPIVIGYAGGDKSLMSFLEDLRIGTVFWCTLSKSEADEDNRITGFLRKQKRGYLVNIRGFDEVMYGLLDSLLSTSEFDKPNLRIRNHAEQRAASYQMQLKRIVDSLTQDPDQDGRGPNGSGGTTAQSTTDNDYDTEPSKGSTSDSSLQTLERLVTLDSETSTDEDRVAEEASLARIRGAQAYRKGQFDEALKQYTEAVRLEPGSARYHDSLSATLHAMGRYEEALAESYEAVRLEPGSAEYHDSLSATLHAMGRYDEALAESDEAVRLEPGSAKYHFSRGATLHAMGRYEEALEEKSQAVRLEPGSARYHRSRGVTLQVMGRYEEALEEKSQAVRLEPSSAEYHDSRGVTLHAMGRYEEALEEKSEAVRLEPGSAEYHRSRGVTLRKMNRLEESLEEIDRAIEIAPDTAINHGSRAETLRAMVREEEAQKEEELERSLST